MTITATPASVLPSVSRFANFSTTITFSDSTTTVNPTTGVSTTVTGTIVSANCVKNFVDANIVVANGDINNSMTVTISGIHKTAFSADEIRYVEKGSSDLLQTPTILYNISDVPPNKDLYYMDQDPADFVVRTYTVDVVSTLSSATLIFTQTVINDVTVGYNFLRNYF